MRANAMTGLTLSAALLTAATPAIVQQRGARLFVAGPTTSRILAYGPEARQGLELFTRVNSGRSPLIVYVHGGGWSTGSPKDGARGSQPDHFTSRGYAYATVAYRFVPAVTVEQQLSDIAEAIAYLRRLPEVQPDSIVLIGHSSGAHLAALLATDPAYLGAANVPFEAVRGVVLLDPAALDVSPFMAGGGGAIDRYYRPAFGSSPERWSALSPIKHLAEPNAPAWAVFYDANNMAAAMQGADLAAGLIGAGADARLENVNGTSHLRLNNEIGQPGDRTTISIDTFLTRLFPERQRSRRR
jgi:acetyl esterase/lipase